MELLCSCLVAYPTANQEAETVAKVIISLMTEHAYLPMTILSDKGSVFVSQVTTKVTGVLELNLEHATTKHVQTIGMFARAHASPEKALKIETGERSSIWHKCVNKAVPNYITSFHTSIG